MAKSNKSIEEKIEDIAKKQLDANQVHHFAKTESINTEIDEALTKAESKSGGKGGNYPDIKLLIELPEMKRIPVMIEVKGRKGDFAKFDKNGNVLNYNEKGDAIYENIKRYAVNGAVHYAQAIINYSKSFQEVIAIGYNGYEVAEDIETEIGVYYLSRENMLLPKKISEYTDLSFLSEEHLTSLLAAIRELSLTDEEKERRNTEYEIRIESILQKLNQRMEDKGEIGGLNIKAESRVQLVCGMIMAALGYKDVVAPLETEELKGQLGKNTNDGAIVLNRIKDFLNSKNLPQEKKDTIGSIFSAILQDANYYTPRNGESPIKSVYITINDDIMPMFRSAQHLDFTGRLFNVLTSWIPLRPGDDKNDVVLTPRYVTEMMARLCKVDMNSYVWDYAAGSGGFLVSAMKLMIEDAQRNIKSKRELATKIDHIQLFQLLGLELRPEIYILAVLNMILMGNHLLTLKIPLFLHYFSVLRMSEAEEAQSVSDGGRHQGKHDQTADPLAELHLHGNVGFEVFGAGNFPCFSMSDPNDVYEYPVKDRCDQVDRGELNKDVPESARAVDQINGSRNHGQFGNVQRNSRLDRGASDFLLRGQSQLDHALLHVLFIEADQSDRPVGDTHHTNQQQPEG